jgi:adenine-specific DNA-methyltransferase
LKCDAIRTKIEKWKKEKKINENEYYFLLASLVESTDKVANTASVY